MLMSEVEWTVPGLQTNFGSPDDQVWTEEDENFTKVRFGGKVYDTNSHEVRLLGARKCPTCAKPEGSVPGTFMFCSSCGSPTIAQEIQQSSSSSICHWPSFVANGWPESATSANGFDDRAETKISGGDWALLAVGEPAVLIAYDHEHGQVLRYEGDKGWAAVSRVPSASLNPWQRSLIASRLGLFFATEHQGLGFLPTPLVSGTKMVTCSENSRPLGGLSILNGRVYLPTFCDGKVRLEGCSLTASPARQATAWCTVDIVDAVGGADERFGAPYTNEASDIFWSAEKSYIAVANTDEGITAQRISWRKGFSALPAARPFRSRRGGGAWQLGNYVAPGASESEFAFHLVSQSTARQELRPVDGPHLSYGLGTFRGDKRYDDPWAESITDYDPASDDKIFVPLATFGEGDAVRYVVAIIEGREKLWDMLSDEGISSPTEGRLFVLGRRQGNIADMRAALEIQSPHDISSTIFGNRLFVYARCENRIVSWRIVT
jgi:hypothetical protein